MKDTKSLKLAEQNHNLAKALIEKCQERHILATAESCTGGLLSAKLTDISGSSSVFDRAFITYSNAAKIQMLDVQKMTLRQFGAVSEQVANEMLQGALNNSNANISISITGIAGPGGGTAAKPVGTICFSWGSKYQQNSCTKHFSGVREEIRAQAVNFALTKLVEFV